MYETILQIYFVAAMCIAGGIATKGLQEEREIRGIIQRLEDKK